MIIVNIDKILKEKDKTVFWLAKECKTDYNNLKKLVDNKTNGIKFENLETICSVLECDIQDILETKKE